MNERITGVGESSRPSSPILLSAAGVLIATLSGLLLPLHLLQSPLTPIFAWIVFLLSISATLILTKKIFFCVIAIMAFASLAPAYLLIGMIATITGCIVSTGLLSSQVLIGGKGATATLIITPILTYLTCLFLTQDPLVSCLSLVSIPASLGIGFAKRRGAALTTVCVMGTLLTLAGLGCAMVGDLLISYGYFSIELVLELLSISEGIASELLKSAFEAAGTAVTDAVIGNIADTVAATVNLLPGIVCSGILIMSYLAESVCRHAAEAADVDGGEDALVYSPVSAIMFVLFYIISFTTNASGNAAFAAVVCANLSMMLLPGLLVVGTRAMGKMILKLGIIGLILAALVIFVSFSFSLYVLALLGAIYTVVASADAYSKSRPNKGE